MEKAVSFQRFSFVGMFECNSSNCWLIIDFCSNIFSVMVLIKIFTHLVVSTWEDFHFHFHRFPLYSDEPFLNDTVHLSKNICKTLLKGLTWFTAIYHCYCVISCTVIIKIKIQMWMSTNFVSEAEFLIFINMILKRSEFIFNQPFDDKISSTCCRILKLRRMKFVIRLIRAPSPLILILSFSPSFMVPSLICNAHFKVESVQYW